MADDGGAAPPRGGPRGMGRSASSQVNFSSAPSGKSSSGAAGSGANGEPSLQSAGKSAKSLLGSRRGKSDGAAILGGLGLSKSMKARFTPQASQDAGPGQDPGSGAVGDDGEGEYEDEEYYAEGVDTPGSGRQNHRAQEMDRIIHDITGDNYFLGTGEHARKGMPTVKTHRKKTVVMKMPVIIGTPYGKVWSIDVLALYHNALKKELQDMYTMVESMYKFQLSLGFEDIERFYTWWEVFAGFVVDYFDIEENVIFPYISERAPLGHTKLNQNERANVKGRLSRIMGEIDDMEDHFLNRPPGEMLPRFVEFLDRFSPTLLGYFHTEETIVPKLLQKHFQESDRAVIQSKVFDFVRPRKYANENFVLQSRWLTAPHLKVWKAETLKGTARVFYNVWRANVEKSHFLIVNEFKQRVIEDELEAMQAAENALG